MRVLLSTLPLSRGGVAARARRTSARALRRGAVAAKSAERGLRVYDHRDGPHTRSIWWSAGPGPLRTRAGRLPAVGVAATAVRPCAGS